MTAEIAVLNKTAVALAADSKVTVGPRGSNKTYDTVNKLFCLSKYHPVGIMIYGNAEFMSFPWETLIKLYRKELGDTSYARISQYADNFISSISSHQEFSKDAQEKHVFEILLSYYDDIGMEWRWKLFHGKSQDAKALMRIIVTERLGQVHREADLASMKGISINRIDKLYRNTINKAISKTFGSTKNSILTAAARKALQEYSRFVLLKDMFSAQYSGVVIAGFGEDEAFPTLVAYDLDGIIAGRVKQKKCKELDVTREGPADIFPFAQDEMVKRFLEGIDPSYKSWTLGVFWELLNQFSAEIIDTYVESDKDKKLKDVQTAAVKVFGRFLTDLNRYEEETFSSKIRSMIGVLPKEELANLAESLVNLTSLKRRVSMESESVGGPVDVAVISRGDGFIWIKRKHYFDATLNPGFLANYYRGMDRKGASSGRVKRTR